MVFGNGGSRKQRRYLLSTLVQITATWARIRTRPVHRNSISNRHPRLQLLFDFLLHSIDTPRRVSRLLLPFELNVSKFPSIRSTGQLFMSRCGRPTHRLEIPASHGMRTLVALGLESEDLFTLAHLGHAGRASRSRVEDRGVVISDALVVVSVSPHRGLLQTVLELKVVPVDHHGSDIRFAGGLWLSDTQVGGTINRLVETELGDLVLHLRVLFHDVARDLLVFGHFAFIGFVGLLSVIQHRGNGLS